MTEISIIVPAYNEEKYLYRCLEALVNQDFDKDKYEIILVNNNSADKTKEIALSFKKVKVIDEPRQGCVHALIKGCKEARGKIFLFTDADSTAPKDWVSKYCKLYQTEKVVCASGPGRFRPIIWQTILFIEPSLYIIGIITSLASGFNLSIRRKTYFEFGGFNPNINFNADTYLQIKAKRLGKVIFLKNNFVITSNRHYKNLISISYILKGLTNFLCLFLFKKTLFYEFGNIRDEQKKS